MSGATLTRISRRDLADAAVRTLRVAGVSHGEAKRAAAVLDHLEIHRGTGIVTLAEVVDAGLDTMTIPERIGVRPAGPNSVRVDAGGASGLLVTASLVDLLRLHAADEPTVLWLASATQLATLEAVIAATVRSGNSAVAAFVDRDGVGSVAGSPTPEGPALFVDRWPLAPLHHDATGRLSEAAARGVASLPDGCRSPLLAAITAEWQAWIHAPSSSDTVAVIAAMAASESEAKADSRRQAVEARSSDAHAWDTGLTVDCAAWTLVLDAATRFLVIDDAPVY